MNEKDHRIDDYFVQYSDMVIRNICLYVDYHTAEDLCQETFIRLSDHLDSLKPEEIKRWLLVVSERLALDYLKKGGQYSTTIGLEENEEKFADQRSDTALIVEEREESRIKGRVLERLKREKRDWYDALILYYVGRMSDDEISRRKGVKKSLVGKWRQRAKEKLREWYELEYPERDR